MSDVKILAAADESRDIANIFCSRMGSFQSMYSRIDSLRS